MGLLSLLTTDPVVFFITAAIIIMALTIHEYAHAWVADYLGDPTPRYQGRVSLNPLAHLDPLGTILLFLVGFGWGKPVMFDPHNLRSPKKDIAAIAVAGPISNLCLALFFAVIGPVFLYLLPAAASSFTQIIYFGVFYNCMLAIFNLVPVYPLDGSKIALSLLPKHLAYEYDSLMTNYGMYILLALIFPWGGQSPISLLIQPVIQFVAALYLTLASIIVGLI
ncbi:site-2 protease family protein [Candidatus Woesebacteria bacterium]|nr:site-2 protease family protein [Candidatus Woesebacteria bacterium]